MSIETPLTHVKRNLILFCSCHQRLPFPMSKETVLEFPYPCQEKSHSVLSLSTGTPFPLIHVKRNLTLLCPCQQRLPLPMSTETSLCSAPRLPLHISRETEAHSAHAHVNNNITQTPLNHVYRTEKTETHFAHLMRNRDLLCSAHVSW